MVNAIAMQLHGERRTPSFTTICAASVNGGMEIRMKFTIYPDYQVLSDAISSQIQKQLREKPDSLICIAAGHSSLGIFDSLINLFQKKEIDFSKAYFVAMDEWLHMNADTDGSCSDFLVKHFLSKVNFPAAHIRLVDGKAENLEKECSEIKEFIDTHGPIDYLLLGVGMNGHLALNEPGVDLNASVHVTELDSVTKTVGTKYFNDAPTLSGGVTIGIADMAASKKIVLAVNGTRKKDILKKIMDSPVTN